MRPTNRRHNNGVLEQPLNLAPGRGTLNRRIINRRCPVRQETSLEGKGECGGVGLLASKRSFAGRFVQRATTGKKDEITIHPYASRRLVRS